MYKIKEYSNTNIKNKNFTILYQVEYTEKDEDIKDDFSNLKQITCKDLEQMIESIFKLKLLNKYNIGSYILIEDKVSNDWIIEDNTSHGLENIKLNKDVEILHRQQDIINQQEKKIESFQEFLKQYNAIDIYKQWMDKRDE